MLRLAYATAWGPGVRAATSLGPDCEGCGCCDCCCSCLLQGHEQRLLKDLALSREQLKRDLAASKQELELVAGAAEAAKEEAAAQARGKRWGACGRLDWKAGTTVSNMCLGAWQQPECTCPVVVVLTVCVLLCCPSRLPRSTC